MGVARVMGIARTSAKVALDIITRADAPGEVRELLFLSYFSMLGASEEKG